jgi:hypothetical protein
MVQRGHAWDDWDLKVGCSLMGSAQIRATVEEHGAGKQMFRFKIRPQFSGLAAALSALFILMFVWAQIDRALVASGVMLSLALIVLGRIGVDSGFSIGAALTAIRALPGTETCETSGVAQTDTLRASEAVPE